MNEKKLSSQRNLLSKRDLIQIAKNVNCSERWVRAVLETPDKKIFSKILIESLMIISQKMTDLPVVYKISSKNALKLISELNSLKEMSGVHWTSPYLIVDNVTCLHRVLENLKQKKTEEATLLINSLGTPLNQPLQAFTEL